VGHMGSQSLPSLPFDVKFRPAYWRKELASQSPLKDQPLRLPGQSLDEEIDRWQNERLINYFITASSFFMLAFMEWIGYLTRSPRRPILFSVCAISAIALLIWRVVHIRRKLRPLRLGRHGERVVGQFLEGFRGRGGRVFHDVPGPDFNVDHVLICPQGIFAVETKTWSLPWPAAKIIARDGELLKAGLKPDRDPMMQAAATARWLQDVLARKAGHSYEVRGIVAVPGWRVEADLEHGTVCVIEPKQLPDYIAKQRVILSTKEIRTLAFQLSRHIRETPNTAKPHADPWRRWRSPHGPV
jgi:hypothetical protein